MRALTLPPYSPVSREQPITYAFGCPPACGFSVLNVQHTFVPNMLHQENPAVIINTGSKQGITNPP